MDTHDEYMRRGNMERVFPLADSVDYYLEFFQTLRYSNTVLAKWLSLGGPKVFEVASGARDSSAAPRKV